MKRAVVNLKASIQTDSPAGTPVYDFQDDQAEVNENTGIERNGGISTMHRKDTTFATPGAKSRITSDGRLLQVDSSDNVRLDDAVIGNVGPLAVARRGMLAGYLDAAWTEDGTILAINRVGTVITVTEYDPATQTVLHTRDVTFASMPSGLILHVLLVKYVDMSYADDQEFVVSSDIASYHLAESGTAVSIIGATIKFTTRTSASAQQWLKVAWSPELNLFCAVADNGAAGVQVMTSPTGVTWTSRTAASARTWNAVCWSPELSLFCAVAVTGVAAGQVMVSADGSTWTSKTSANAQQWTNVCWSPELKLFCAVANDGAVAVQVMTSPDGTTWTARTSASAQQWNSVCWSSALGIFCAVAINGAVGVQVMTSSDGVTWNSQTSASAQSWRDVCWSPQLNLFCAVAYDGAVGVQVMTSPDGVTWTSRTSASARQWLGVTWSPELGLFCAVAGDGTVDVQAMISTDGISWDSAASPNAEQWTSICYSPALRRFCAVSRVGAVGVQVMTSSGFLANLDTGWKFAADKYLFGRQGIADTWAVGTVVAPAELSLWRWAIFSRFPGTVYSRAILTRDPTQVSTSLIGYGEVGYDSAGSWSATPVGYGPTLAAATATISNPISAPGYSECTYVRSDTGAKIYYYHAPDFAHAAISNYSNGEGNTHTPINAYGKLTDLWNAKNAEMVSCLVGLRVCMAPTVNADLSLGGIASFLSAAPLAAIADHIGVPITLVGEYDDTFVPHVDDDASTYSRAVYRYNGNLYYVEILTGEEHRIDRLNETVYQVNCLSAISIVDTVKGTLEVGVNDFNGRTIPTSNSGAVGANHQLAAVLRSPYAGSVDPGDKIITNYVANGSVSIPGIEIPVFIDRQTAYGVDVYMDDVYEETFVSRYSYQIVSDKQGVAYVTDTRLPVAHGYAYGDRVVQTEVATILLGVGVTGSSDINFGYAGYELGNELPGTLTGFWLFGQRYLIDDFKIYAASFDGSVYSRRDIVCPAVGMQYIASSPVAIWLLSTFDNSIYVFNGGRSLTKGQRLTALGAVTDGVFSVLENTLLLQTANTLIWIRDGIVSLTAKVAAQTNTVLYDTTGGIVIANDTDSWSYGLAAVGTVVALAWQSPFMGVRANLRSVTSDWTVRLYAPVRTAAIVVTLTCASYDEDKYAENAKKITVRPSDWNTLGYCVLRIQPKTVRALAASVKVECSSRVVINDVSVEWGDEAAAVPRASRSA